MSARIDGEVPEGDAASIELDAHLAGCANCRAAAEALQAQDAALVRAFAGERRRSEALAEAVVDRLGLPSGGSVDGVETGAGLTDSRANHRSRWWRRGIAAVAAGILLGIVLLRYSPVTDRLWALRPHAPRPSEVAGGHRAELREVAHVTLATGNVFTCPPSQTEWRPTPVGSAVGPDTRIRTPASARCELQLSDGTRLCLNADTEARLAGDRRVELERGQLWSAVPAGSSDMCVTVPPGAGDRTGGGSAAAAFTPPGGQSDLACTPGGGAVLTVVRGAGRVTDGSGAETLVKPGEALRLGNGASAACTTVDAAGATRWIDELLLLREPNDPELLARVGELLARIRSESATRPAAVAAAPGAQEEEVRARGPQWSAPMACYVLSPVSQAERDKRIAAARLLADLAPPWTISDLITMLGDRDGEIREHAARALLRLTGQQFGDAPYLCPTESPQAAAQRQRQWQAWWETNQAHYPKQPARR